MSPDPVSIALGVGAITTAVAGVIGLSRGAARRGRRLADFLDDWNGEPERAGVPARPGVMTRLASIEGELRPNGGGSMRDAVARCETGLEAVNGRLTTMEARLTALEAAKPVTVNVGTPPASTP